MASLLPKMPSSRLPINGTNVIHKWCLNLSPVVLITLIVISEWSLLVGIYLIGYPVMSFFTYREWGVVVFGWC